ncbi:MAG: hypothetical protein P8013_12600 [Candidatus Sulfobium sp.]|jgi:hypothetical protein
MRKKLTMDSCDVPDIYVYRIDRNDRIVFISDNWLAFAEANEGADSCHPSLVLDKSLWDFIAGPETRHLYDVIIGNVRTRKRAVIIHYRCDSPAYRRFMEMTVNPLDGGGVEFRSRIVRIEERDIVALLEDCGTHSEEMVTMCSFCKKVRLSGDEWVEAEEAVERLDLFGASRLPQISHGVCQPCYDMVFGELPEDPSHSSE